MGVRVKQDDFFWWNKAIALATVPEWAHSCRWKLVFMNSVH